MSVDLDMAVSYRQRARELRLTAADPAFVGIRITLLDIALDYDRLAERLEAADQTNKTLAKRLQS